MLQNDLEKCGREGLEAMQHYWLFKIAPMTLIVLQNCRSNLPICSVSVIFDAFRTAGSATHEVGDLEV